MSNIPFYLIFISCLLFQPILAQQIQTLENESSSWVNNLDTSSFSVQLNNTIPNASIWFSLEIAAVNETGSTVGSVLSVDYVGATNISGLFYVMLTPLQMNTNIFASSFSTCSTQFRMLTSSDVDVGDKVGTWTITLLTYLAEEIPSTFEAVLRIGAQSGPLNPETLYTLDNIEAPATFFDFDLSGEGDFPYFDVTFTLNSTSGQDLSWVTGLVANPSNCVEISLATDQPIEQTGQRVAQLTAGEGGILEGKLEGVAKGQAHLAILTAFPTSFGSPLSLSWTAQGVQESSQGGDDEGWDTTTIVLGSVSVGLALVVVVLAIVVLVLVYQLKYGSHRAIRYQVV